MFEKDCQDCSFVEIDNAYGHIYLYCKMAQKPISEIHGCMMPEERKTNNFGVECFDDFHNYDRLSYSEKIAMGFWLSSQDNSK